MRTKNHSSAIDFLEKCEAIRIWSMIAQKYHNVSHDCVKVCLKRDKKDGSEHKFRKTGIFYVTLKSIVQLSRIAVKHYGSLGKLLTCLI